jgi:hypothetical protein
VVRRNPRMDRGQHFGAVFGKHLLRNVRLGLLGGEVTRGPLGASHEGKFYINRHSIREIKISCCSMWPAVFRIGFRPAKNRLDASMGLAKTSAVVR